MRPDGLTLTAALVAGCASAPALPVAASPLIARPAAALVEAQHVIEPVRWRYRSRWWAFPRFDRLQRDLPPAAAFAAAIGSGSPLLLRSDRRRRGGWVDPPPE